MTGIVCLAEDSYWNGVCALINALHIHNFRGFLFIGYRGNIPKWISQFKKIEFNRFQINDNLSIKLDFLNTKRHFGYHKAFYIEQVLSSTPLSEIFYFDTDCIPITDYNFYKKWTNEHITLCSDENYDFIHENHPWKIEWKSILNQNNVEIQEVNHKYVNSGYIGIPSTKFNLIKYWTSLTLYLEVNGFSTNGFNKNPVNAIQGDQEILNMALCTMAQKDVSIIGREGMGFQEPLYLMIHCTSSHKPWSKNFIWEFFKDGVKVSPREKKFLSYSNKPFSCYNSAKFQLHLLNLKTTAILSRIF